MIWVIFFSVHLGVEWGFCQKYIVFLWADTKFIVEGVMPNLLHVIPVSDDTMLNRVLKFQNTSFRLSFVSNVSFFVRNTNHHLLNFWSTYDTWKDSSWCIVTRET